jgi:hypothetical protein
MRQFFTLLLSAVTFSGFSQAPNIDGTYLPVAGTIIHQVYDTTGVALTVPTLGANQVWDYANAFVNIADTGWIETYYAGDAPHAALFPDATHATFLRAPFFDADSLWTYLLIDTLGIHTVGGYATQAAYNAPFTQYDWEYVMPHTVTPTSVIVDTAYAVGIGQYLGLNVMLTQTIYKEMEYVGFGTCTTPIGTFSDVALGREHRLRTDSFFVDVSGNGNYQFTNLIQPNPNVQEGYRYHFLRNNTFGSTHLMQIQADPSGNVGWAWYTLPVSIGAIEGLVWDELGAPVTNGEVLLYRENSNFSKNDILDRAQLDANGNYFFDSIPYGEYRVAARADQLVYDRSLTSYVGDTTNWMGCQSIVLSGPSSIANNINLSYRAPLAGQGNASGVILLNQGFQRNNDPIPGLDVVVQRSPGGSVADNSITDLGGAFDFQSLDDGDYTVFVDIPGLHMAGSYDFTVAGGTVQDELDFIVSLDSIYPVGQVIQSTEEFITAAGSVKAWPNPYEGSTNIRVKLDETSEISLEVFNMLGESVAVLDAGNRSKGEYTYVFGADAYGYSSGVYLVRLAVNGIPHTIKLVQE